MSMVEKALTALFQHNMVEPESIDYYIGCSDKNAHDVIQVILDAVEEDIRAQAVREVLEAQNTGVPGSSQWRTLVKAALSNAYREGFGDGFEEGVKQEHQRASREAELDRILGRIAREGY